MCVRMIEINGSALKDLGLLYLWGVDRRLGNDDLHSNRPLAELVRWL